VSSTRLKCCLFFIPFWIAFFQAKPKTRVEERGRRPRRPWSQHLRGERPKGAGKRKKERPKVVPSLPREEAGQDERHLLLKPGAGRAPGGRED